MALLERLDRVIAYATPGCHNVNESLKRKNRFAEMSHQSRRMI